MLAKIKQNKKTPPQKKTKTIQNTKDAFHRTQKGQQTEVPK
jgi:hypothetical protein